jgi:hypothetical protein
MLATPAIVEGYGKLSSDNGLYSQRLEYDYVELSQACQVSIYAWALWTLTLTHEHMMVAMMRGNIQSWNMEVKKLAQLTDL